jgi:riboflavin biosynthesis pyrimidine reductase
VSGYLITSLKRTCSPSPRRLAVSEQVVMRKDGHGTADLLDADVQSSESAVFAATWQAADKVVFSSTLAQVHTRRTRLERQLDGQVVAEIKAASRGDPTVGGPTLAAEALRLDLVDVVELLWCPTILGGGIPVLSVGVRRDPTLRRNRRFGNGMVQTTYDVIRHDES